MGTWLWLCLWGVLSGAAIAQERLILVGGGEIPAQAAERFVAWGGGTKARLLFIEWASGEKICDMELRDSFAPYHPESTDTAPMVFEFPEKKEEFFQKLEYSTAVFFGGGDQNRVMDLLEKYPDVQAALTKKFASAVFGGTSAGTAIMSATMITGEGDFEVIDPTKVGTRPGLGFVRDIVLDQHFIKRQRLNRLLSVLTGSPERWGMGIDEGTSVAFENQVSGEVLGPNPVMLIDNRAVPGRFLMELIPPGGKFTLK